MRDTFLPYGHQWIDEADERAVLEALRADRITTGEKVLEFEQAVASYCGASYGVAVSSGTAALHAACTVAGISKGDEVITTPITFFATVAGIMHCGGTPVLADVRPDTVNIDPVEIRRKVTNKTKAIIPVDFAGHPVDFDEVNHIAEENNLVVIEDACHALGASYQGKKVGGWSDMTVFSFHPVKSITTGEGGMVLTDDREYYSRLLRFRNHNIERGSDPWLYNVDSAGYNYRLSDVQCALGLSQLRKLDTFIARRREITGLYDVAFAEIESIGTPTEMPYVLSAYHLYVIRLAGVDRDKFIREMLENNIGVQVHYAPVHYHSALSGRGYQRGDFPAAEAYYSQAVSLPIFPRMTDDDVGDVIYEVERVARKWRL